MTHDGMRKRVRESSSLAVPTRPNFLVSRPLEKKEKYSRSVHEKEIFRETTAAAETAFSGAKETNEKSRRR